MSRIPDMIPTSHVVQAKPLKVAFNVFVRGDKFQQFNANRQNLRRRKSDFSVKANLKIPLFLINFKIAILFSVVNFFIGRGRCFQGVNDLGLIKQTI